MNRDRHLKERVSREKKQSPPPFRQYTATEHKQGSTNYGKTLVSSLGNATIQRMFEGGFVQAKLELSTPGDRYEKDADRIAEQVVSGKPVDPVQAKIDLVQAKGINGRTVDREVESEIRTLKGKGRALDRPLREYFEPRMGVDLGHVRIHTGDQANRLATTLNARAFTQGNNIVFKNGEYQPGSDKGKKLLAHELTHTIQQGGVKEKEIIQRADGIGDMIYSRSLQALAWTIENTPDFNFVPIPGLGFIAKFMKGMLIGSLERMSEEEIDNLWTIMKNIGDAVTSWEYMKAYFWGFLKGFFGDFILLYQLPGMAVKTAEFIGDMAKNIAGLTKEDIEGFAAQILDIKSNLVEGGEAFLQQLMEDIKAGKATDILIETLKSFNTFTLEAGKRVGRKITSVTLEYFSQDHEVIGKDLGSIMGEIAGTVAFSAIIIAVTYGAGSVWVAARSAITTVRTMIGKAVAQGMKFITAALKTFRTLFARIIKGARAAIKAFGEIRLLKTFKGKLDDILVKVKNLVDDILLKLGRIRLEVGSDALKHSSVGEFTINPRTQKISRMKAGGHSQKNLDLLNRNNIEYNIEKTYSNGVRVGNVPQHKVKLKRTGTSQSWFPANWTDDKIKKAGESIANLSKYRNTPDGYIMYGNYDGVRVGVIKTNGKIATIFPDSVMQP